MNYINLPPGRKRRLAYSNHLLNIQTARRESRIPTVEQLRRQRRTIHQSQIHLEVSYDIYYRNIIPSYNILSELKDVKVGVQFKNLVDKSKIGKCDKKSFCVICQDDIEIDDIIRIIDCKHNYHINCIDKWFIENKKCPMCKFEI